MVAAPGQFIALQAFNALIEILSRYELRAHIHQVSASMLQQLCDDATDTVLIENNGVAQKWVATPIWSDSIVFYENIIASVIAELSLTLGVNGP